MKKILCALGAMAASLPLFAEGGASAGPDFSAATTALADISSALKDWAGAALPYLIGIASAFLIFWLGKLLFRLVKGWANSAK